MTTVREVALIKLLTVVGAILYSLWCSHIICEGMKRKEKPIEHRTDYD